MYLLNVCWHLFADLFIQRCRDLSAYIGIIYIDSNGLDNEGAQFDFNTITKSKVLLNSYNRSPILEITLSNSSLKIYRSSLEPIYIMDCTKGSGEPTGNLRKLLDIHHRMERSISCGVSSDFSEINNNTQYNIKEVD